jgi:hypothetical protein
MDNTTTKKERKRINDEKKDLKRINFEKKVVNAHPLLREKSRVGSDGEISMEDREVVLGETHSIYKYVYSECLKSVREPEWLIFDKLIHVPAKLVTGSKNGIDYLERQLNRDIAKVVKGGYNNKSYILVINPRWLFAGYKRLTKKAEKAGETVTPYKKAIAEYDAIVSLHPEIYAKAAKNKPKLIAKPSENNYNSENDNHSLAEYEALKLENEKLRARNQKLINESEGDCSEEVERLNSLLLQERLKNQKLTRQVEELSKHPQVLTDTKKTFLDNKIKELLAQVADQHAKIERLEGQPQSKNNSEKLYTEQEMEEIRARLVKVEAELANHKADSDAKFDDQEQRITKLEAKVHEGIDLAEDGLDLARRFAEHVKNKPDLNKMGKELKEKIEEFKRE